MMKKLFTVPAILLLSAIFVFAQGVGGKAGIGGKAGVGGGAGGGGTGQAASAPPVYRSGIAGIISPVRVDVLARIP